MLTHLPPCVDPSPHLWVKRTNRLGVEFTLCGRCFYRPGYPVRTRTRRRPNLKNAKAVLVNFMGSRCGYCGTDLAESERTVDHIVPRCRGGIDHLSNYTLACERCNIVKGTRTVMEWLGVKRPPFRRSPNTAESRNR